MGDSNKYLKYNGFQRKKMDYVLHSVISMYELGFISKERNNLYKFFYYLGIGAKRSEMKSESTIRHYSYLLSDSDKEQINLLYYAKKGMKTDDESQLMVSYKKLQDKFGLTDNEMEQVKKHRIVNRKPTKSDIDKLHELMLKDWDYIQNLNSNALWKRYIKTGCGKKTITEEFEKIKKSKVVVNSTTD